MKVAKTLANGLHKVSLFCVWISGLLLFGIAAFIFVDVFARYALNNPITGSQEVVQLAILCVLYLGLPFSTYNRSHVRVDALTSKFSPRVRDIVLGIITLLCMLVSAPIAVQMYRQGINILDKGTTTVILKIPQAPFYFLAAFGNVLLTFEFLCDGLRYLVESTQHGKKEIPEAGEEEPA